MKWMHKGPRRILRRGPCLCADPGVRARPAMRGGMSVAARRRAALHYRYTARRLKRALASCSPARGLFSVAAGMAPGVAKDRPRAGSRTGRCGRGRARINFSRVFHRRPPCQRDAQPGTKAQDRDLGLTAAPRPGPPPRRGFYCDRRSRRSSPALRRGAPGRGRCRSGSSGIR